MRSARWGAGGALRGDGTSPSRLTTGTRASVRSACGSGRRRRCPRTRPARRARVWPRPFPRAGWARTRARSRPVSRARLVHRVRPRRRADADRGRGPLRRRRSAVHGSGRAVLRAVRVARLARWSALRYDRRRPAAAARSTASRSSSVRKNGLPPVRSCSAASSSGRSVAPSRPASAVVSAVPSRRHRRGRRFPGPGQPRRSPTRSTHRVRPRARRRHWDRRVHKRPRRTGPGHARRRRRAAPREPAHVSWRAVSRGFRF